MELWKEGDVEGGGSQKRLVNAFLGALKKLQGTEQVIKQIKSESVPKRDSKLTKRLADEIAESGKQGRGNIKLIDFHHHETWKYSNSGI